MWSRATMRDIRSPWNSTTFRVVETLASFVLVRNCNSEFGRRQMESI